MEPRDIGAFIDVRPLIATDFVDAAAGDGSAKASLILDVWGGAAGTPRWGSISFWLVYSVTLNAAADTLVVDTAKLEESDAANMAGDVDIWSAQTLLSITAAGSAETTTGRVHLCTYDMAKRKRYLRVTLTPTITEAGIGGVSSLAYAVVAVLGNPDTMPGIAPLIAA